MVLLAHGVGFQEIEIPEVFGEHHLLDHCLVQPRWCKNAPCITWKFAATQVLIRECTCMYGNECQGDTRTSMDSMRCCQTCRNQGQLSGPLKV